MSLKEKCQVLAKLATNTALTVVENKIPNVSHLLEKNSHNRN